MKKLILNSHLIIFFLLFGLTSCNKTEKMPVSNYTVVPSDFEDNLTLEGYVDPTQSISIVCPGSVNGTIVSIIKDGTYVNKGDIIAEIEDKDLLTNYNNDLILLEKAISDLNESKANLELQYSLMEAQVKINQAEGEISNLDAKQMQFLSPNQQKIKKLELEKTSIERKKLQKRLKALDRINKSEVRKLEMRIKQFESRVERSKQKLESLVLTAPKNGIVLIASNMITGNKITIGDMVWDNVLIASIPESEKMRVKLLASEGNFKRIEIHDSVFFSFDAQPENYAWGKITIKSPVGQPVKKNSSVKMFELEASIDSSLVQTEPGFSANCKIVLDRVPDTIVVPQVSIFEKDSMKVVYVQKKDGYELRQVITGKSSPERAIITKGLKRNEIISLIEPSSGLIKLKTLLPDSLVKIYSKH